jgi:hypothetical protein
VDHKRERKKDNHEHQKKQKVHFPDSGRSSGSRPPQNEKVETAEATRAEAYVTQAFRSRNLPKKRKVTPGLGEREKRKKKRKISRIKRDKQ